MGHRVQVCVTWFKYVVATEFCFYVHEFVYAVVFIKQIKCKLYLFVEFELFEYCTIVEKMQFRVLYVNYA